MTAIKCVNASVAFERYTSRGRGLVNHLLSRGESGSQLTQQLIALDAVNLELLPGDRLALIGRNGAGKSTLLKLLAGIYEPTSGQIVTDGFIMALTDVMLGMDPDADALENTEIRSIYNGVPSSKIPELFSDVAAFTELGERLWDPIRTYSSGMLLRFAFALATSLRPKILLMDEMIGAGDQHFRDKANSRLHAMMDDVEILVIASHDASILSTFCNKGLYLKEGKVKFTGTVESALEAYAKEEA